MKKRKMSFERSLKSVEENFVRSTNSIERPVKEEEVTIFYGKKTSDRSIRGEKTIVSERAN